MIAEEQIGVFKKSADTLYSIKDYTSATILYFKTLFAIQDLVLLKKLGESPKDHKTRFRKLESYFPELYKELDLEFSTYIDTYSKTIDKSTCYRIRGLVENDIQKFKIKGQSKETSKED